MTTPVASLSQISKRYRDTIALSDVSLTVDSGECLALVGHNGSGKSTLIKILIGLVRPQGGSVSVLGRPPGASDGARARGKLGYLPENVAFDPGMTARQVMRFFARLKGLSPADVDPMLERVGLSDAADRPVRGYSKGMRQRLGLAQALLGDPALLLLDEPTTGLDPALKRRFYDMVFEVKNSGCAVLISSHALGELEAQADSVAILSGGRLAAAGTLSAIREQADLPVRLVVRTQPCRCDHVAATLPAATRAVRTDSQTMTVECRHRDKMDVLRALVAHDQVLDVATVPVSLDDLYVHFAGEGIR